VVATTAVNKVIFTIGHDTSAMKITADGDGGRNSTDEDIEVVVDRVEPCQFAMDVKYLTSTIKALRSELVSIAWSDPLRPFVFTEVGTDYEGVHICMPMGNY